MKSPTGITAQTFFAIIPEWILDAPLSATAVRVYCVLRRYADNTTGECYPSRRTLAARTRCSVKALDRAVKELVDLTAITVTARKNNAGDWSSNLYTVMTISGEGVATEMTLPSVRNDPTGSVRNDPLTKATMNQSHELSHESDFADLWKAYPRKVGKAAALRVYGRLRRSPDTPPTETLIAAVTAYAKTITDIQFCAHLSTWLNARRWEDETVASKPTPVETPAHIAAAASHGSSLAFAGYSEQFLLESVADRTAEEQTAATTAYRERRHHLGR